jgi:hypothetical protein
VQRGEVRLFIVVQLIYVHPHFQEPKVLEGVVVALIVHLGEKNYCIC